MGRRNGSHTQSQSSAASSHSTSTSHRHTQVDTSSYSGVITISVDILCAGQQRLWGNKLILVSETELTSRKARDWIDAYNQEANIKFTLHDELQYAIFVVKIEVDNLEGAKKSLIHRSPFKAHEIFVAVNDYYCGFDASNPFASADFKHLVTVYIKSGDPDTFEYLNFVVKKEQARQGLVGTEYWRRRAEEEQRRKEEELLYEATRAVDFEAEQATRLALPNQFSPSRHTSPHDIQHPGDLQGGNSQSQHSSPGAIPTIPIATTQRSSSYVNPRRRSKKSWGRTGQGHLLGSNDASCSQEAPAADDNLVTLLTLP
ncbi:unnamed protein product [Calypogeia fissa]